MDAKYLQRTVVPFLDMRLAVAFSVLLYFFGAVTQKNPANLKCHITCFFLLTARSLR